MIYQYVKRYLKHTLVEPKIAYEWSAMDNLKFLSHVGLRYGDAELTKEISEVKEAFKDFFEPVGTIIFRYKEETGIKFKVFPYRVEAKDSIHLKNIIKIIHQNRKAVEFPYHGQTDQIAILGKIRREINRETADTKESVNIKELIKYAIRKALELNDKDIIVGLKRKYIVKIFDEKRALEAEEELAQPTNTETTQDRFNGYTAQQIEETYKDIFEKGQTDIRYFLNEVMKNLFVTDLNFRSITNRFYEENALK